MQYFEKDQNAVSWVLGKIIIKSRWTDQHVEEINACKKYQQQYKIAPIGDKLELLSDKLQLN